eukprot:g12752.t1
MTAGTTRSADDASVDQPLDTSTSSKPLPAQPTNQAGEGGRGGEMEGEGKAPVHDASDAGQNKLKAPTAMQAHNMVELAKVTQTLREDAAEAMDEMRKRAARYRETPKDSADDLTAQMEGLEVDGKMALYDKLFEAHPVAIGKAISKMERDETEQTGNSTLVYGEITFKTLALALHKVKTKYGLPGVGSSGVNGVLQGAGGTFYDIGSGTGKPVIAAAILHPFHRVVGIEILEGLYSTSVELLKAAYFKVLEHDMFPMSWGSATVYISQKTTDPFGDPNAAEDSSSSSVNSK